MRGMRCSWIWNFRVVWWLRLFFVILLLRGFFGFDGRRKFFLSSKGRCFSVLGR